jgi:meso-butanediol dehydrogenase / (S,S)-butanediol dehydrogenase / diacetyl reductase
MLYLKKQIKILRKDKKMPKKIAIVTGGASGMGLATAIKLHNESGFKVIIADLTFSAEVPSFLDKVACDVGFEKQVENLFQYCQKKYGRLDLFVNFAGVHTPAKVKEATTEEFESIYRTNILGTFLCSRAALRLIDKGVIVNIASSVGIAADKDAPLYSASKAYVIQLTKCMALEYGKKIRCNTVCPGPVNTKFLRRAFHNDEKVMESYARMNPRGRIAKPEEVADYIAFVVSEKGDFINGATIQIDGGESISYGGEPEK